MIKDLKNTDLFKRITEQYKASDAKLQAKLPEWGYILDCWRGQWRDENYYDSFPRGTDTNYLGSLERLKKANQSFEIYVREIFRVAEAFLAKIDMAYLSGTKPFSLDPPAVMKQPPQDMEAYKRNLGVSESWFSYEFRRQSASEVMVQVMRDACLLDYGIAGFKADFKGDYPVALFQRFLPWETFVDAFAPAMWRATYAGWRNTVPYFDALRAWPGMKDEQKIKGFVDKEDGKNEIRTLHWVGIYGDEAKDVGLLSNRVIDIIFLCDDNGAPSGYILDAWDNPWQTIPLQEFKMTVDPEEEGMNGVSMASTIEDTQYGMNRLTNMMLQKFEYSTMQGGFFDSQYAGEFPNGLKMPHPGEYLPFPASGQDIRNVLFPLQYQEMSPQHMQMINWLRTDEGRTTSIQDNNYGLSVPTDTGTLGESNALKAEANEGLKAKLKRLDPSFERLYKLWVLQTADLMNRWQKAGKYQTIFVNYEGEYLPLDPSFFDEEFEVNINSGARFIDGPQRAMKNLLYLKEFKAMGLPVKDVSLAREIIRADGLDPDLVVPTDKELAEQQAAQQQQMAAMAMLQMAAAQQNPPSSPSQGAGQTAPTPQAVAR
jgi:hypothetical protein